jgi:AcrR family transcriptional regulator
MIFYYFPTKDDLFLAVVEEVYGALVLDLSSALEGEGPTRARLQAAFARLGRATDDEVEVIRLILREALLVPTSPRFSRLMARFREGHLASVLRTIARGLHDGELDATVPVPLLMMTTFAMGALPQILRRIAGHEPPFSLLPPPDVLATTAVELLFRGVAPQPERETEPPPKKRKKVKRTTRSRRASRLAPSAGGRRR